MTARKSSSGGNQYRTEVAPNGYRPVMGHHELLDLHRAHPDLYKQLWMVALGSFALYGDGRSVGVLRAYGGRPYLIGAWFDDGWNESGRFPFVSKP